MINTAMISWYHLNIPITNAFCNLNPYKFPMPYAKNMCWQVNGPSLYNIFHKKWLDQFEAVGYKITGCMVFWKQAHSPMANLAHIDLHTGDSSKLNHAGFNVIVGGHDSAMTFYKLPETQQPLKFTMAKTPYIDWHVTRDNLELVDTFDDYSKVAMVRVDIPHAIKTGEWPRLCYSFRCDRAGDNPWEQTVEDFAKAGLLIPREQPVVN